MVETECDGVFSVQSFTEKPERDFAKIFMARGEFRWNTGIFIAHANRLADCFRTLLPVVLRNYDDTHPVFDFEEENRFVHDNFPSYPNVSLDSGILEKTDGVCVMHCDFGWADLGTWHGI